MQRMAGEMQASATALDSTRAEASSLEKEHAEALQAVAQLEQAGALISQPNCSNFTSSNRAVSVHLSDITFNSDRTPQ